MVQARTNRFKNWFGDWEGLVEQKANKISLQDKLDYAREIIQENRTLERLSQTEEQSRTTGGKRNVEASAIAGASQEAGSGNQGGHEERQ